MKQSFKLFNFKGIPVELSIWFFLLFLFLPLTTVIAVFISILVHELAHAYVADRLGWMVSGIHIDLFSGSAAIDTNIHERDSIPVVAAGPISNLILAGISLLVAIVFPSIFLATMIVVNILLFLFNILPIYPMDGGRLLRDTLYLKLRDRRKSVRISAIVSLITTCLVLVYAVVTFSIILMIFCLLFGYMSLRDLNIVK